MSNKFKRTPTCGENDVDLRVATEPRRVTDAVLSQIIAAKDGEISALTAEVTHLAEKLAVSVDRNSVLEEAAAIADRFSRLYTELDVGYYNGYAMAAKRIAEEVRRLKCAPQPVDAAQAVPEGQHMRKTASLLQSFADRLCNDPAAGTKYEGDEVALRDAIVLLRRLAAPSPAAQMKGGA